MRTDLDPALAELGVELGEITAPPVFAASAPPQGPQPPPPPGGPTPPSPPPSPPEVPSGWWPSKIAA